MSKPVEAKNDWNDEDDADGWDDWGDAEESPKAEDTNETKVSTNRAPPTAQSAPKHEITTQPKPSAFKSDPIRRNLENDKTSLAGEDGSTAAASSSWGIWGVLSKATEGLGNITGTVSQGLNQVIGVPDPEELARINAAESAKDRKTHQLSEDQAASNEGQQGNTQAFCLGLVTSLGSKVINTGLDTLEGIGKKTMEVLQSDDPMLMNKRKLLGLQPDGPNLSEVLQEAKKDADKLETTLKELRLERYREQLRFESIFENECGLVHLEALEILSKGSRIKVQGLLNSVIGHANTDLQETVNEVKELMEMEEIDYQSDGDYDASELQRNLSEAIVDADVAINFDDIVSKWSESLVWLNTEAATADVQETFCKGINALGSTCALAICKLHKIAELMLIKEHHSTANEVDAIAQLCTQLFIHMEGLTHRYAALLTSRGEEAKLLISTLFTEMQQATQHIKTAFNLFLPIMQMGAV